MVIGVTREFIEDDASEFMIGIPRMLRLYVFIALRWQELPAQAIVFDVIDTFQEQDADDGNHHRKRYYGPTKLQTYCQQIHNLNGLKPNHLIVPAQCHEFVFAKAFCFQSPSAEITARHRTYPKGINHFAKTS